MKKISILLAGVILFVLAGCNRSESGNSIIKDRHAYFQTYLGEGETLKVGYTYSHNKVSKITSRNVITYSSLGYEDRDEAIDDKENYLERQENGDGNDSPNVSINIRYKSTYLVLTFDQKVTEDEQSDYGNWDDETNSLPFDKVKEDLLDDNYEEISRQEFYSDKLMDNDD